MPKALVDCLKKKIGRIFDILYKIARKQGDIPVSMTTEILAF